MQQKIAWLFTMAWRDSRTSRGRLALFTISIILGVAALVAIDAFEYNLRKDIESEAQSLLGADLSVTSNFAFTDSAEKLLDSLGGIQANERLTATMVYNPETRESKFAQLRALEDGYPFYGEIDTEPSSAAKTFRTGQRALIDGNLMMQLGIEIGDSVRVGKLKFEVVGELRQVPGGTSFTSFVSTPVYIPLQYLDQTGLVRLGSRIQHRRYVYYSDQTPDLDTWAEQNRYRLEEMRLRYATVQSRKESLGNAFGNLSNFLNLVGFLALLLGAIGVGSAVQVYVKEKTRSIAILRCLGASSADAFLIFLIQIAVMGMLGSLAGVLLGMTIQRFLPMVIGEFLPVTVTNDIAWPVLGEGFLTGVIMSILFALLPLLKVRRIAPLQALRTGYEPQNGRDPWRIVVGGAIVLAIWGFSWLHVGTALQASIFTAFLAGAFGLLAATAALIMRLLRKVLPTSMSYLWRQGLSNLYRPNNQTLTLLVTIGLGTMMIGTLYMTQHTLRSQLAVDGDNASPNLILFDIQKPQKADVAEFTQDFGLPVIQETPVVTIRLDSLKGRSRAELLRDTTVKLPRWTLNYEYRVTYRDELIDNERILDGDWISQWDGKGAVPISLEKDYAENQIKVTLGDEIVWNVQGVPMKTRVASIREMDLTRLRTNFIILFPAGALEDAPQIHTLSTRSPNDSIGAAYQRALGESYPTISAIDIGAFLETFEEVLGKISFIIEFMAFFSIATGVLVLISSVLQSRFQRIKESVLLRTLGASRQQVLAITAIEYLALGLLATFTGLFLAILGSAGLTLFAFEVPFLLPWGSLGILLGAITGLTILIGYLGARSIVGHPPLEILRSET